MYDYVGPTWAQRSFDPPGIEPTNLAEVWKIPYNKRFYPSTPPGRIVDLVAEDGAHRPIVWVYSDPWGDIPRLTGCTFQEYVSRSDWFDVWREANQQVLRKINSLGVPVFLIGAHCDIIDCDFSNITIACQSWQKHMADQIGLLAGDTIRIENRSIDHCVAQEIYFRYFHENPNVPVSDDLKNYIIDLWMLWKRFHDNGIMYEHHPTKESYQNLAKHLEHTMTTWINQQQC